MTASNDLSAAKPIAASMTYFAALTPSDAELSGINLTRRRLTSRLSQSQI